MKKHLQNIIYFFGLTSLTILILIGCTHSPKLKSDISKNTEQKSESNGLDQINTEALQHMMDGQLYLDQGDFAMAIVELQEAQSLEPNVSSIYVSLAECYWNLKKPERAMEYLESAIEIEPDNTSNREVMAEQLFRLQNFAKSEEQYKILLEMNPDSQDYLFALSDLAKIQKKYDLAIKYYQDIIEKDNKNIQALELVADLTHRLSDFNQADKFYKKLLNMDSLNVNYLSAYADIKVQLEEPEEAIELIEKVIVIEGSSTESLTQLGLLYSDLEQDDKAIDTFNRILEHDSTNTAGLHLLSTIYRENEEYERAQVYADKMTVIYPENPQGIINSALIALGQDDSDRAINILSPVAPNFPEEYSVQYLLGMSYNLDKNYKMAAVFLDNARQIAPNSRNTLHLLAIVNDNLDNYTISDGIYQQLIQSDSTDAQAFNNYAYSLIERGDKYELSKKYSRKAIELAPEQAAYLDTYGWILFKMGDLKKALKYINQSLEIDNKNVEVLEHKGDILIQMKKIAEAQEYYEKALLIDPENKQIIDKLSDL